MTFLFSRAALGALLTASALVSGCASNTSSQNASSSSGTSGATLKILNVSYDPTRELYQDFNKVFAAHWKKTSGQDVKVDQSHGGSGKQAQAVLNGQEADVVTLALAYDIDRLADDGLLAKNWATLEPDNSSPYTSTIVFLVRAGNPKGIKDWGDLIKAGVSVVTANPKTGGGARWNYLAAYGYAKHRPGGTDASAQEFVKRVYANVAVLDKGARDSTNTFVKRGIGDVLLTWENEAFLATKDLAKGQFEIVTPPESIVAEPPVAVVSSVAKDHGTEKIAKAYLDYLYSPEGQDIVAKHYYRPRDAKVAAKYAAQFPKIKLWTLASEFKDWRTAQKTHFDDRGVFDRIYTANK